MLGLAAVVCGEAEIRLRRADPGEVILDEFLAMPLCFLGWRLLAGQGWPVWGVLLAGFALFRAFDILKPFPLKHLEQLPGGFGVVMDDVAAGAAARIVLAVLLAIRGGG